MKKIIVSFLIVLGLSTAAFAQTPSFPDANGNGELSFAEVRGAQPNVTQANFAAADVDKSGGLNPQEFKRLKSSATPAATPADPAASSKAPAAPAAPAAPTKP